MMNIDPFDIVSGKVAQNHRGTFWFKEPGHNIFENGEPKYMCLHKLGGPAAVWADGRRGWFKDGYLIKIEFKNLEENKTNFLTKIAKYIKDLCYNT